MFRVYVSKLSISSNSFSPYTKSLSLINTFVFAVLDICCHLVIYRHEMQNLFIHTFIRLFICLIFYSDHKLIHQLESSIHSFIYSFTHSFIYSVSFIHSIIYPSLHSFVRSFCSFISVFPHPSILYKFYAVNTGG